MSVEKNTNARIQHKHDIEANWSKATNFIPKAGELVIYDADENYTYARIKIGDGVTAINDLSFIDETKADKENVAFISEEDGEDIVVETAVLTNVAPETVAAVIGHKEDEKYEKVQIGQKMPDFLL